MFHDSAGNAFHSEQSIFPLISFEKETQHFKCLGTAFFIDGFGIFVTARHVVINEMKTNANLYGIQTLSTTLPVIRDVLHITIHPTADIAVGLLGNARNTGAELVDYELAPNLRLSFKKLNNNDDVIAFGFPRTTKTQKDNLHTFNFKGSWANGIVLDFLVDGTSLVRNKCYQTNMFIDSGSSGGPVFKDNCVVGINSSSMDIIEGELPLSFITPVDLLLDLHLPIDKQMKSIGEIIDMGGIIVEY